MTPDIIATFAFILAASAPAAIGSEGASGFMNITYLIASICFILTLQFLSSPRTARYGNMIGAAGMALAVVATLFHPWIKTYVYIVPAFITGSLIGASMAIWIPMTKMPERIALSHSFGGLAAALFGVAKYHHMARELGHFTMAAVGFECFFGFLTFTGSLMAFSKLQGMLPGKPITFKGQNKINVRLFFGAVIVLLALIVLPTFGAGFYALCGVGLALGVLFVLPIGGADMPVVISLLNSYGGLAAAATGFALNNYVLIIAGALDGSSGLMLSVKMSQAMNRSFRNVLFGAFGTDLNAAPPPDASTIPANVNQTTVEEVAEILSSAQSAIIVPGYGMAVSQAQHAVRDLAKLVEEKGATVKYAVHPVAGRMPGHMNVLLAEANVPYDQLFDLDDINDEFPRTDVVLIVGANDVVNPAANKNPKSPIYGMPVFNVDKARTVIIFKRSLNPGFSGIENELFFYPNTLMLLGDAKKMLVSVAAELKDEVKKH